MSNKNEANADTQMKLQWEFCLLSEIKVNKPDSDKVESHLLCGVLDHWTRGAGTFHLMPLLCAMVSTAVL